MAQHALRLHDAGHRCKVGIACGFQRSFHGRWNNKNVTFAYGRGEFASFVVIVDGHLDEDSFRDVGTYTFGKLNRAVSYRQLQSGRLYAITQHGTAFPAVGSDLFPEGLPILNVQ